MASATATIPLMGKSKKPEGAGGTTNGGGGRGPGRPPGRRPTFTVFARVNPIFEGLTEQYLETTRPRTSMSALVELALEEFFRARGLYPPQPGTAEQAPPATQ